MKSVDLKSGLKGHGWTAETYPVSEKSTEVNKQDSGPCIGMRHVTVVISFLIITSTVMVRQILSVSLVGMVNYTAIGVAENPANQSYEVHGGCFLPNDTVKQKLKDGEFVWNAEIQGIISGAFFWGAVASMFVSSYFAQNYGGKMVTLCSQILVGVSSLLTPLAAYTNVGCLIAIRAISGFGMGATIVGSSTLMTRWVPKNERGSLNAIASSGSPFGTIMATSLTGLLTDSHLFGGWPSAFYFFGTFCLIVATLWLFLVYGSPSEHPWISMEERRYIEAGTGVINNKLPTPWRTIVTSLPVWALVVGMFGYAWTSLAMGALLPTYMRTILHFNIKENGFLSSLPYVGRVLASNISSQIGDKFLRNGASTNTVRKTLALTCLLVPGFFLVISVYVPCDRTLGVSLFVVGMSMSGCAFSSLFINQTDLAPNFTGPILSFVSVFGNFSGIAAQYSAGLILTDLGDISKWRIVIFICLGINLFAAAFFFLFGSAEQQSWNQKGDGNSGNSKRESLRSVETI